MVCTPVVHDIIGRLERAAFLPVAARCKPGAGPGIVCPLPENIRYFLRQSNRPALGNLQHGPKPIHQIQADHRHRHLAVRHKTAGIAAAAEIAEVGIVPGGSCEHGLLVFLGDLVPRLHDAVAILIACLAAGIECGCAGIDQVQETAVFFGNAFHIISRHALDGLRAPISTHVGEHLGFVGQQLHEEHAETVQHIIFRCKDVGFAGAVVVKSGIENSLGEVTVGIEVRPLSLALEAAGDGIVADHFLFAALRQVGIAVHQVFDDQVHLQSEVPILVLLLAGALQIFRILIKAFLDIFVSPGFQLFEFLLVVDALCHAADHFHLVDRFHTHAEILFNELAVNDRAADAHADGADLEVALAAHRSDRNSSTCKAEQLFLYILGNNSIIRILDVMAVNAESRQPLLGMGCKHRGKIHSTWALGSIEAPDGLDGVAVHIHRLSAIAPARCDGQGDCNAFPAELCFAGCGFCHTTDGSVGNDYLHRLAVGIAQVFLKQLSC